MLKNILGLVSLLFALPTLAGPLSTKSMSSIGKNWAISDPYTISQDSVKITTHGQQRMIRLRGIAVSTATLTSGVIRSSTGKGVPKDLAAELAKLVGITSWKKEDRGSYIAYEAPVPNEARLLKLFVGKDKKNFRYSVASIRTAYLMPVYFEAELYQRQLMEGAKAVAALEKDTQWSHLFQLFVTPAYAADSVSLADLVNSFNGSVPNVNVDSNALGGVQSAANNLGNQLGGVQSSINGASSSVNNLAGAGNNLAGAGNNLAAAGNNVAGSIDRLSNEANAVQGTINDSMGVMKESVKDINQTLKGFQDPKVYFKVGLASGFGYTLGSMLVQFASDGAASLVKKIFYEVSGQMDPETRDRMTKRGKAAWDQLEKLSARIAEIDKNVQVRLAVLASLNGKDPVTLANELEDRRALLESDIRKMEKALDGSSDSNHRLECSAAIRGMRQQSELINQMQPILRAEQPRSQVELCASFDRLYQEWANVELQMHNSRSVLLNEMVVLATGAERETREANESLASDRKKRNECENSKLEDVEDLISDNDCSCKGATTTQTCNYLCMEQKNYQEHENSCLDMIEMSSKLDKETDSLVQSELIRQNTTMLEDSYRKLSKSYCVAGDTSGVCDGQDGSFSTIHAKMQNQFKKIQDACGSSSVVATSSPRDIMEGKRKALAAARSSKPLASTPTVNLPKVSEGGGFFSNLFESFMKFLKGLF